MKILRKKDGNWVEVYIKQFDAKELKKILKSKRFGFDWHKFSDKQLFKLCLKEDDTELGLMAISSPEDPRIQIDLIESSVGNIGKNKEYEGICGCLLAYACRESFRLGYDGYISLIPKTVLKNHYIDLYGFEDTGMLTVFSDSENSLKLIQKFIKD